MPVTARQPRAGAIVPDLDPAGRHYYEKADARGLDVVPLGPVKLDLGDGYMIHGAHS